MSIFFPAATHPFYTFA